MQDGIRLRETDGWMDRRCSLKAMPDPEPAKMKMSMEMNSETAALAVSGCDSSPGVPTAILLTGIMVCERVVRLVWMQPCQAARRPGSDPDPRPPKSDA